MQKITLRKNCTSKNHVAICSRRQHVGRVFTLQDLVDLLLSRFDVWQSLPIANRADRREVLNRRHHAGRAVLQVEHSNLRRRWCRLVPSDVNTSGMKKIPSPSRSRWSAGRTSRRRTADWRLLNSWTWKYWKSKSVGVGRKSTDGLQPSTNPDGRT